MGVERGEGTGQDGPSAANWLRPRGTRRHIGFTSPNASLGERAPKQEAKGILQAVHSGLDAHLPVHSRPSVPSHQESGSARNQACVGWKLVAKEGPRGEEVLQPTKRSERKSGESSELLWVL